MHRWRRPTLARSTAAPAGHAKSRNRAHTGGDTTAWGRNLSSSSASSWCGRFTRYQVAPHGRPGRRYQLRQYFLAHRCFGFHVTSTAAVEAGEDTSAIGCSFHGTLREFSNAPQGRLVQPHSGAQGLAHDSTASLTQ